MKFTWDETQGQGPHLPNRRLNFRDASRVCPGLCFSGYVEDGRWIWPHELQGLLGPMIVCR